jgi:hypothetical protein
VSPLKFPSLLDPHRRTQVPRHAHVQGLLSLIRHVGASGAFSTYCSFLFCCLPCHLYLAATSGIQPPYTCFCNGLPLLCIPPPGCTGELAVSVTTRGSYVWHSASVHMLSLVSSVLRFLRSALLLQLEVSVTTLLGHTPSCLCRFTSCRFTFVGLLPCILPVGLLL